MLGVVLVFVLAPGVRPADVGLVWPPGHQVPAAIGFTAYFLVIVLAATVLLRRRARQGKSVPGQDWFVALLPGCRSIS
ncbi:hypothetical protein HC028_22935 [Planosporangium flavigriseum]|uniref:Uncharacterized protein n=1 Tax=Planosporangium flavigriseum TaxID=373681 RepID=A0A8J3LRT1_9ACTN|nr:hypothetical protein [Planosporangium flavigriseum]NJC67334.1 hypothetical protein [Planosporangium flavigriseum]GIG75418.1 hypothetical protein Pfl04_38220 [Planosporangium flavigriseum]